EEWESDKEDDPDKVFYGWERSKIFNIVGERHREIFDLEPAGFMVKGATPEKMLEEYTSLVRRAIREEDFSMLLSDVRHFQVVRNNGLDHYVTSGPGLEKEVMNLFFKTNLDDRVNHYLVELIDDYTTISAMPLSSSTEVSQSRLQDLTFFGAVVGLSLVHGSYPANINPLLLVYLLNHSNLKSISKHLVMDQFPTLYHTLARWKALDPRDNNLSLHRSLAWTMLHNAVIGPISSDHPYFQAFYKGLMLPCKPVSLNLPEMASNFCGGISEFVLSLLESRITGDYESLRLDYTDRTSARTRTALQEAL
ncbi:hypothetical protein F5880DRAFT_1446411, partial [Lentinula raphanica]